MTDEEMKSMRENARIVFNNPLFRDALKQAHGSCFRALMDAVRKNDQVELAKNVAAMDTISTIYEHFRAISDEEPNSQTPFDLSYGE